MSSKENLCYLEIYETTKEVTEILYQWSLEDIRKFMLWLRENRDSDLVPWKEN